MKVNSVSVTNYKCTYPAKHQGNYGQCHNIKTQAPGFKGIKGAAIGSLGGLAYLGLVSILAAPFMPITLGAAAIASGVGALAGHNIEKDYKHDKNMQNDNNKDNK